MPLNGRLVVTRTRDSGTSFAALDSGLPKAAILDLVYRHALVVDDDGARLAMGSTTGNLWVSDGGSEGSAQVDGHLPPIAQMTFLPEPR